ncbi:hypothetical protein MMC25_001117 [Agyrium rufum]|nr:hypothetical protein [Agyrium rufum]
MAVAEHQVGGSMGPPHRASSTCLFQVHLRLRPAMKATPSTSTMQQPLYPDLSSVPSRFLTVEPPTPTAGHRLPTHITIHPPSESRKRAVEKFAFTKVFEERASQLDIFTGTGAVQLVEGLIAEGRDGLLATLGVTGSGKSHTILGTKAERGLTQLSLELVYRSLDAQILQPSGSLSLVPSLQVADVSEAQIISGPSFLDGLYGDIYGDRYDSRATTPMVVGRDSSSSNSDTYSGGLRSQWSLLGLASPRAKKQKEVKEATQNIERAAEPATPALKLQKNQPSHLPFWHTPRLTRNKAKLRFGKILQDNSIITSFPRQKMPRRPSAVPSVPDISNLVIDAPPNFEYAILISMYEVYNDRIFDLLCNSPNGKDLRRRSLLFKSTESSPDRKVVAGLRKIVCGTYEEALMVLETGLMERRVAGTGSNSVSSRSHGFFCVELKKRRVGGLTSAWTGSHLTVVDLAGSERARHAKTAGATLAEAGKINESLMYLGQCLQMQSDHQDSNKPSIVPFRQCKLTELLFSNSFPSSNHSNYPHAPQQQHRNPQKGIMIVTADPLGDFNATSQILRYSAMAREITVPRIPSVSSTILAGVDLTTTKSRNGIPLTSGRNSPNNNSADLDAACAEIERLLLENEVLSLRIFEEHDRRVEAEDAWQRAEEMLEETEMRIREECWEAMEKRVEEERRRWMSAWTEEGENNEEHLDRKLEILSKGVIQVHEDEPSDVHVASLEDENATLRNQISSLERALRSQASPTKPKQKATPKNRLNPRPINTADVDDECILDSALAQLQDVNINAAPSMIHQDLAIPPPHMRFPSSAKSPGKKMRKLTPRAQYLDHDENLWADDS